jgi:hypothetical protein
LGVDRGLTHRIGDALVWFIDWTLPRVGSRLDDLLGKAGDVLRPDPPITITTLDRELLTGLIVADRGQVILFVGVRSAPTSSGASTSDTARRYDDGSIPLWARGVDPRESEVDPYRRR